MVLLFFVLAIVARHLGPDKFGTLSYVAAVSAIFGVIGQFGFENVVVKDLVGHAEKQTEILGTSFALKFLTYLCASSAMIAYGFFAHQDNTERSLFVLSSIGLLITPFLVTHSWFNARVMARSTALAGIFGNIISSASRLAFVVMSANIVLFAASNLIQTFVSAAVSLRFFIAANGPPLSSWRYSHNIAVKIMAESWTFFLGSLFSIIYLKMDVALLRWLSGPTEAGLYSVATQISEAAYFVPGAILTSIFPAMIALRQSNQDRFNLRLQQIFDIMLLSSLGIMIPIIFIGAFSITLIFGDVYGPASSILIVHVLAMPFIFMGTAFVRWIVVEKLTRFFLFSQGAGIVVNGVLNLLLIPILGGVGAAIATVISYAIALYLILAFHPQTRPIFAMMSSSLFAPWAAARRAYALRLEL